MGSRKLPNTATSATAEVPKSQQPLPLQMLMLLPEGQLLVLRHLPRQAQLQLTLASREMCQRVSSLLSNERTSAAIGFVRRLRVPTRLDVLQLPGELQRLGSRFGDTAHSWTLNVVLDQINRSGSVRCSGMEVGGKGGVLATLATSAFALELNARGSADGLRVGRTEYLQNGDLIVEGLTRFEHVHSVSIDHAQFSEPWELQIPSLTKLTLRWCRGLDGNWLEGLQRCTALTAIALRGGDLTDSVLCQLQHMPSLRKVRLHDLSQVTDAGVSLLARLVDLEELEVHGCKSPSEYTIVCLLKTLTKLKSLQLGVDGLTFATCSRFADLHALEKLVIWGCGIAEVDDGLAQLKRLNLKILTIRSEDISDCGLGHLAGLVTLETLAISDSPRLTNAGLRHLSRLKALKTLELASCPFSDFSGIAGLTQIQDLSLNESPNATDASMGFLNGFKNLSIIQICDCPNLTDATPLLFRLGEHKALRQIFLVGCPRVTAQNVRRMLKDQGIEVIGDELLGGGSSDDDDNDGSSDDDDDSDDDDSDDDSSAFSDDDD
jgi:hypothetical protein